MSCAAVDYKAAGTLQRSVDAAGRLSRDEFDGLLDAMVRAGLIEIEDAEYEKDGEVRRFRKVRLTEAGLGTAGGSAVELLISDGMVEEFGGQRHRRRSAGEEERRLRRRAGRRRQRKRRAWSCRADAARRWRRGLREWRAAEAKTAAGSGVRGDARPDVDGTGAGRGRGIRGNCWRLTEWAPPRWRSLARPFLEIVRGGCSRPLRAAGYAACC